MKNVKRVTALIVVLALLGCCIPSTVVFADTKSDAEASIQFTPSNRVKLYQSLSSSGLSAEDVMAKTYVLEDFNEWSTERAAMAGAEYMDYSSWEEKATEKAGGTLASANGIALPITGLGTYGQFTGGNQFLINLLKLTSTSSSAQATVGWFGTPNDGYYGFKNTGGAKKIIDTTPTTKISKDVSEDEEPVYTSTTDSLLYVGDTDNDGKNDVEDWLNFEGTIVLSYDWLVAPVTKVTTELMTLDNIAVHYNRTTADGSSRSNQIVGDFPITGLPMVYYDTNTSTVKMRSHCGIDFSQDNPNYKYFEDETSANRLRPWKLCNDTNFFNTTDVEGILPGDWVNITVVLDVQGTLPSNRVIYQREFLNGELVKNEEGESVCTIKPYDTEYTLSTSSSLPAAPESCSLEGYPYDGKWANWAPAEYYGIGVSFSNGQASQGWGGIDNLCYRIYNDTELKKSVYQTSDIADGKLEIELSAKTGVSPDAPRLANAGIIDLGDEAKVDIVKTDVLADPLLLVGNETSASVDKVNNLDMTGYCYQGTVTGKKYYDGTAIRISGLETLSADEAYVVAVDTVDAREKKFRKNVIITDSNNVQFAECELFDFLDNDVSDEATLTSEGEYSVPSNTSKIVLYSSDDSAGTVTVEGNGNIYTADFEDGRYTISFGSLLTQNSQYTIKKNGNEVAQIVPSEGSFVYEAFIDDSGKPALRYVNVTNNDFSGFLIGYNSPTDMKAENIFIPSGGYGEVSMTTTQSYDNVLFLESVKEDDGESELDSICELITPFIDETATVTGNLTDKNIPVMLIVLKGDDWVDDTELANSIMYIDFTTTKDTSASTVDGIPYQKGDYEFEVTFPASFTTDKYTFIVYAADSAFKRIMAYGKAEDAEIAVETFKSSPQAALADESTRNALGLYYGDVENLYTETELIGFYNEVAEILEKEIIINPIQADAAAAKKQIAEMYNQAAIATAVINRKLSSFDKVSSSIKVLNTEPLKGYWLNNTGIKTNRKDSWKTAVLERLGGKVFDSISPSSEVAESFEKALVEALILQVVLDAESVDAAKNVMSNSFNGLNTLEQKTVTTYTAGTVMNSNYSDIAALQAALTRANNSGNAPKPSNKPDKKPSGGGGSISNVTIPAATPSVTPVVTPAVNYSFTDMTSVPWAEEAVLALKKMGVINGKSETEFAPNDNVTREEFVKMIVNLADVNVEHGDVVFSDVTEGEWYYTPIKAAFQKKIISGISETEFGVGKKITRQDMAVIAANVLSYLNISVSKKNLDFADADNIADYAKDAVSKLTAKGIINGYEDNSFRPEGFATRAEAAKILYGLLPLINR